jgi:hypothetical protein
MHCRHHACYAPCFLESNGLYIKCLGYLASSFGVGVGKRSNSINFWADISYSRRTVWDCEWDLFLIINHFNEFRDNLISGRTASSGRWWLKVLKFQEWLCILAVISPSFVAYILVVVLILAVIYIAWSSQKISYLIASDAKIASRIADAIIDPENPRLELVFQDRLFALGPATAMIVKLRSGCRAHSPE